MFRFVFLITSKNLFQILFLRTNMPGVNWAKNLLLGKELTNKEMEDIPYPRLELHAHVMCKTIEVLNYL